MFLSKTWAEIFALFSSVTWFTIYYILCWSVHDISLFLVYLKSSLLFSLSFFSHSFPLHILSSHVSIFPIYFPLLIFRIFHLSVLITAFMSSPFPIHCSTVLILQQKKLRLQRSLSLTQLDSAAGLIHLCADAGYRYVMQ